MDHLIPAEFHGTPLSIIDHGGQKWLTAAEIGGCLGYDPSNARKGVLKLYERHGDEFTEEDTGVVKLTTPSGKQVSRIFSATGCIKLGFFASTPRSSEFRTWASKVLAARHTGVDVATLDLARENGDLKDMVHARDAIIAAKDGVIMGLQDKLIGSQGRQIRLIGQVAAMQKRQHDREIIQLIERMEAEGKPRDEIAAVTGKNLNYIRQRVFIARQAGRLPQGGEQ
jgi:prophage antirepressor-like protein